MPNFEVIICAKDFPDKRAKEGDIIDFKPEGHVWGKKEKKEWRTVTLCNISQEEIESLCVVDYEDGLTKTEFEKLSEKTELAQPKRDIKNKRLFNLPNEVLKAYVTQLTSEQERLSEGVEALSLSEQNKLKVKIDMSEKVSIIRNKRLDSFKYKKAKA